MKWEYEAIKFIKEGELTDFLNGFGEIGWELIHCEIDANLFIFKRPKHETQKSIDQDKRAIKGIKLYEAGENA